MDAKTRATHLAALEKKGFHPAKWLPLVRTAGGRGALRPVREIALRLCAIDALLVWTLEDAPAPRLRAYARRSGLEKALTKSERVLWKTPRARLGAARSTVGWRSENAWPLAWVLGFDPAPDVSGKMITEKITGPLVKGFLPRFSESVDDLLARAKPRSFEEVEAMEDLFYCAHNAARSISLGQTKPPRGFDRASGPGVIQERRHALTWCLSPRVKWDDTELST